VKRYSASRSRLPGRERELWIGYVALLGVIASVAILFVTDSGWLLIPITMLVLVALALTVAPEARYVKWTKGERERVMTGFWPRFLFGLLVVVALIPSFALDFPLKLAGRRGFVIADDDGYYSIILTSKAFQKRNRETA
jgi:hypothetical protein